MQAAGEPVRLTTIAREWGRIGCIGFGGPPTHIALLRKLCVVDRGWITPSEFEDGIAACNLLPGPASTQLAMFCAWRLRGWRGALVGGFCFIVPGLIVILALSALFLGKHPAQWVRGAEAGAGAAVAAVAVNAAISLFPASWRRAGRPGPSGPAGSSTPWPAGRRRPPSGLTWYLSCWRRAWPRSFSGRPTGNRAPERQPPVCSPCWPPWPR